MSWLGLVLVVLGAYLAYKVAGVLLKILMFVLLLVGAYWFAAPYLGLPTVSDLVYVLGPDFEGRRIEEVARPSAIAGEVADDVERSVILEQVEMGVAIRMACLDLLTRARRG